MDIITNIIKLNSANYYGVKLQREDFKGYLVTALLASAFLFIPAVPSKSSIFCLHACFLENKTRPEILDGEMCWVNATSQDDLRYRFIADGHECEVVHGFGRSHVVKEKTKLASSVCSQDEIQGQIRYATVLVAAITAFGFSQGCWLYFSASKIHKLLVFKQFKDVDRSYMKNFIKVDTIPSEEVENHETTDPILKILHERHTSGDVIAFESVRKDLDDLKTGRCVLHDIGRKYLVQNCFNLVVSVVLLMHFWVLDSIPGLANTWFQCTISRPLIVDVETLTNLKDMQCFNPDALASKTNQYFMICILLALAVYYIWCLTTRRDFLYSLFKQIVHQNP